MFGLYFKHSIKSKSLYSTGSLPTNGLLNFNAEIGDHRSNMNESVCTIDV